MNSIRFLCPTALLVFLVLAGCQNSTDTAKEKEKLYDVKAKVVAVDMDKPTVTLDHEDIPGLMKAMKMDFIAENPKVLEGIKAGDEVQGRTKSKSGYLILTELQKR